MIKQKINLVADWFLSVRKRLSEKLKVCKTWCSQKVQHFHKFMKQTRINKIVRKFINNEAKVQKTTTKSTTTKKKNTTQKK